MANKYPLIIGGVDITDMVEIDSYKTTLIPVVGGSVTTMDGVTHKSIIREKGHVEFAVNPQTDLQTAKLNSALKNGITEVKYHCTLRNTTIIATMEADKPTARHLGRVRYGGAKWNELSAITLTEL
jgi:hypothetical protein